MVYSQQQTTSPEASFSISTGFILLVSSGHWTRLLDQLIFGPFHGLWLEQEPLGGGRPRASSQKIQQTSESDRTRVCPTKTIGAAARQEKDGERKRRGVDFPRFGVQTRPNRGTFIPMSPCGSHRRSRISPNVMRMTFRSFVCCWKPPARKIPVR